MLYPSGKLIRSVEGSERCMVIRRLSAENLSAEMLKEFRHSQRITGKWALRSGEWHIEETDELREWNESKRRWIPGYMCEQLNRGGCVLGAFHEDALAGFCCLDGVISEHKSANMTMLFVDDRWQRSGIGKALFHEICSCARGDGAEKLFISEIPSVDTISFYFSQGCRDAAEIVAEFVDSETDRYLERGLME